MEVENGKRSGHECSNQNQRSVDYQDQIQVEANNEYIHHATDRLCDLVSILMVAMVDGGMVSMPALLSHQHNIQRH